MQGIEEKKLDIADLEAVVEQAKRPNVKSKLLAILNDEKKSLASMTAKLEEEEKKVMAREEEKREGVKYEMLMKYAWEQEDSQVKIYISEGMEGIG